MPQLDIFTFFNQLVYFLFGFFIFYFFVSYYVIPVIHFICSVRTKSLNFLSQFSEPVFNSLDLNVRTKLCFDYEFSAHIVYRALNSIIVSQSYDYLGGVAYLAQSRYWFIIKWYEHLFFSRYLVHSFSNALEQAND